MRSSVNVSTHESVPAALARLNAYIDDVAQRPGWSYKRVATEAGIDVMTLHAVRQGRSLNPTDRTAWGLDRVLGFKEGKGVQRVLAGRNPVLEKKSDEVEADPTIVAIESSALRDDQKELLKAVYRANKAGVEDATVQQVRELEEKQKRGA